MVTGCYVPEFEDEVELERGQVVEVTEKSSDGWWLVQVGGRTGRAPATFLQRADTHKANNALDKTWNHFDDVPLDVGPPDESNTQSIPAPIFQERKINRSDTIKVDVIDDDGEKSDDLESVWDNSAFTIPIPTAAEVGGSQDAINLLSGTGVLSNSHFLINPPPRRRTLQVRHGAQLYGYPVSQQMLVLPTQWRIRGGGGG